MITKPAPDFELPDSNGNMIKLRDFRGKYVVLYFYPKDNTSGCTLEATDFSARKPEFDKYDGIIIGVSKDSCMSHKKFKESRGLRIILLSDEGLKIHKAYGATDSDGKTIRSTFIIEPKGKIVAEWKDVKVNGHVTEVLERLKVWG